MIELKKETERVILVGVCLPGQEDIDASLEELSELAVAGDTPASFATSLMLVNDPFPIFLLFISIHWQLLLLSAFLSVHRISPWKGLLLHSHK